MAENAPPSTSTSTNPDPSRGMPYYEKLRRDLRESLQKKRALDTNIHGIEESIFRMETSYLEETGAGNIIKGFDNYIKGTSGVSGASGTLGGGTATRRKGGITEADRIFSKSSASLSRDSPAPSSSTTPSHAPTPTSSFPQSARESNQPTPSSGTAIKPPANNKKKKAVPDKDEDEDSKPAKRGKISYGRD